VTTTNRYLEIRLHEHLSDGFRIVESPTQLLLNMQVDHPWSQVLDALDPCISAIEKMRIRLLFESFVTDRNIEFNGEYVVIYEWPPHSSEQLTPES
jgi:hypothetical protein